MASNDCNGAGPLLRMTITYVRDANTADQNQQYNTTVYKYTRAAEVLLQFLGLNTNPRLQRSRATVADVYLLTIV